MGGDSGAIRAGEVARALLTGHPSDDVQVRVELRLPGGRVLHRWARPTSAEYDLLNPVVELEAIEVTEMDLLMADFVREGGYVDTHGYPEEALEYAERHGHAAEEAYRYIKGCDEPRWV
jgi:hypothetical protein